MRTSGGDAFCYEARTGTANAFEGLAFAADNEDELSRAVAEQGASPIRELETPGGGRAVTLRDPDGFQVDLVTGIGRVEAAPHGTELEHNSPGARVRFGRSQTSRALGPAHLYRLGHVGLFVTDFRRSAEWYRRVLGLIPSDVYHVPGNPQAQIVGFLRLDRGSEWVDHHVLALMQAPKADCHHISFEVQDFEAQFTAHRFLAGRGHEPIWGVGRHPHGSHVFDVWRAPDRYRFETFSDTDLLNAESPTRLHDIRNVQMDAWSSDPPDRYFG